MGQLGWCLSFSTSFILYYCICLVWPTENQKHTKHMRWEEAAGEDVVAVDGTVLNERGSTVHVTGEDIGVLETKHVQA